MTQDAPNPLDVRNAGTPWSDSEELRFRNLGQANTPMRLIIRELGRPEEELRAKAEELGVDLDTGNYNRLGLHESER